MLKGFEMAQTEKGLTDMLKDYDEALGNLPNEVDAELAASGSENWLGLWTEKYQAFSLPLSTWNKDYPGRLSQETLNNVTVFNDVIMAALRNANENSDRDLLEREVKTMIGLIQGALQKEISKSAEAESVETLPAKEKITLPGNGMEIIASTRKAISDFEKRVEEKRQLHESKYAHLSAAEKSGDMKNNIFMPITEGLNLILLLYKNNIPDEVVKKIQQMKADLGAKIADSRSFDELEPELKQELQKIETELSEIF
ncbi:MAG: hypothetical protein JWP09_910 [Candidatus Taylorbacteria bacterium]|nr:hypothetical protein [Candidatus Taylorbacteria bacterium]